MSTVNYDIVWLRSATPADLHAVLRMSPEIVHKFNEEVLRTPEGQQIAKEMINDPDYIPVSKRQPDPEEAAQIAADEATAAAQAAADAAALVAAATPVVETPAGPTQAELDAQEDAELKTVGITVERQNGKIIKIVQAYQVSDENGKPIGRPTHLEAKNWAELAAKQRAAHENGVRYAERIKRNRVQNIETVAQNNRSFQDAKKAQDEAAEAVKEATTTNDPVKLTEAVRKVSKAERDAAEVQQKAYEEGQRIAAEWMEDHKHDYVMCKANSDVLGAWLVRNSLPLTYENLELAYAACESQLAKPAVPPAEVPAAPVINPPVAAPAATPAPAAITAPPAEPQAPALPSAPPSTQAAPTPNPTSAAAPNAQPAARRPGVNGGLVPGASTAVRPSGQTPSPETQLSDLKKEIRKMSGEQLRAAMKNPQFRARCEAAGIPFVSLKP